MAVIAKINTYNNGKLKINRIGASAWTAEGEKLCKGFCMKKKNVPGTDFPFYEVSVRNLDRSLIPEANFMSKWWYSRNLKVI